MDPNANWKMLCETLRDLTKWPDSIECRAHAVELLEDLAAWLRKGGYPPTVTGDTP